MTLYLTSINELAVIAAEAQISLNCGLPNTRGTTSWASPPKKAIDQDLWFIEKPTLNGWNEFTQAQMLDGIDMTDIIELEEDPAWFLISEP